MKKLLSLVLSVMVSSQFLPAAAKNVCFKTAADGSAAISAITFAKNIGTYEKLEIDFEVNASYTNPFDGKDIDINGIFTAPDGTVFSIPAFYSCGLKPKDDNITLMTYDPNMYTAAGKDGWHIRFSGSQIGVYRFYIAATDACGNLYTSDQQTFTVSKSNRKGYTDVSADNPEYFANSADGSLFYGSGSNLAWVRSPFTADASHMSYEYFLGKMKENNCNLTRIWLCHWAWLEWTPNESDASTYGYAGIGRYNQYISSALDHIFELCESYGIRLILTLDDNNEHITNSESYDSWKYNPYNTENGGPAATPDECYSSSAAKEFYKNRLRYIIARWGYSDSLMSLNLWNDETTPTQSVIQYFKELNEYTKELTEGFRPLLFGSNYKYSANTVLDYVTQSTSDRSKPSVTQECYYTNNRAYFKNTLRRTLWKELFSGNASAMVWSHDTVDETDSWDIFSPIIDFFADLPFRRYKYSDSYNIKSFADSWEVNGFKPDFSVKNGRLVFRSSKADVTCFAEIKLSVPRIPENAVGISFDYDMHENTSNAIFRISLNSDSGKVYMPWYGKEYTFAEREGEKRRVTVSGSNQWSSWLNISAKDSGKFTVPLSSLNCPADLYEDSTVEEKYKNNIFTDSGSFTFIIQQQGFSHDGAAAYIDNIYWITDDGAFIPAQDFSTYKAETALSAEYSDTSVAPSRVIQARPLGDVSWGEIAKENLFLITESDSDMLLEGISGTLYGTNADRIIYKNDPTFIIESSAGGEMIIELSEIGSGSNIFTVSRNGTVYSETELNGGRRELVDSERYVSVPLTPGTNHITVSNNGHDWISVSGFYFKFYSDDLKSGIYIKRLISEMQQSALLINTKSGEVYESMTNQAPLSALNVKIPFYELPDSDYLLEIIDPSNGNTLKREIHTVTGGSFTATVDRLDDMLTLKLTSLHLLGDANADGTLDIRDLICCKRYLANDRISINKKFADTDFDKAITAKDLILIRKHLLEIN